MAARNLVRGRYAAPAMPLLGLFLPGRACTGVQLAQECQLVADFLLQTARHRVIVARLPHGFGQILIAGRIGIGLVMRLAIGAPMA